MSAKLLMGLTEENPELEKQIGCMTGIFQVFDRHHFITGRRLSAQKRLSFSGQSRSSVSTNNEEHYSPGSPQNFLEYNRNKSSKVNQRVSIDSSAYLTMSSPANDFRDMVKESINAEPRVLSVKTSAKHDVKKDNAVKHRDSPRPTMPADLNDKLHSLARLRDAPMRNTSEVPRFSCDGREFTQNKSSTKLREAPRFSLDSREVSLQNTDRSALSQGIPSVVAKLMGLDALPGSGPQQPAQLAKHDLKKSTDTFCGEDRRDRAVSFDHRGLTAVYSSKQTESVYSQMERRVNELEFSPSNKDLRALKYILDKMQAKGILESKEGNDPRTKPSSQKDPQTDTPREFESPIVIMKPAKSVKRSEGLEGLSGLRKLRTSDSPSRSKAKQRAPCNEKQSEESSSLKVPASPIPRSPRPQQSARERSPSPAKTLNCSSPRVQQKKTEPEKKPGPSTQKQTASRKPLEPVFTNSNLRVKPRPAQIPHLQSKHNDRSMSTKSEDSSVASGEQPSPISVLEADFYQDDSPLSPVKKVSCAIEDFDCKKSSSSSSVEATPLKLSSELHLQKIRGISNLVQKLTQLSSAEGGDDCLFQILASAGLVSADKALNQGLRFDLVKEILVRKLESLGHGPQRNLFLRARRVTGQNLFTELPAEIEQQLAERPRNELGMEDEEMAFRDDLMRQSQDGWGEFGVEVPGLVLEIERFIFRELIDEIVVGEASSCLRTKSCRRRRQLFV